MERPMRPGGAGAGDAAGGEDRRGAGARSSGPAGHGRQHGDLVVGPDELALVDGQTVHPHGAGGQDRGEATPVARGGNGEDLLHRVTRHEVPGGAGGGASGGEEPKDGHGREGAYRCRRAGQHPRRGRRVTRYGDRAMTRLLLVRHGESVWNADGRWQGQADPPLSDRGREQAAAAAASIGTVDVIVTSDLERAAETGAIIARIVGIEPVITEPRLRERDAGPLSGLTRPQIHEQFPGLLADDPGGFVPGPDGRPDWPQGWESDQHLWDRVEVALRALGRLVPDGDVLAVTHGGVMYAVERHLGAPERGRVSNLGAVWLEVDGDHLAIGERMALIEPTLHVPIEADRI